MLYIYIYIYIERVREKERDRVSVCERVCEQASKQASKPGNGNMHIAARNCVVCDSRASLAGHCGDRGPGEESKLQGFTRPQSFAALSFL